MKQLLFLILFTFNIFSSLVVFSQSITSNDVKVKVDKEERAAISINSEAEIKSLEKAWSDFIKKNYKGKTKSGDNPMVSKALIIPEISPNPINVFAFFNEKKRRVRYDGYC